MNRFSRVPALLLCVFLVFSLLFGCSSKKEYTLNEITDTLKDFSSDVSWNQLNGEQLSSYFQFGKDKTDGFSVYVNASEEHFDIIAAVKPSSPSVRDEIIRGLSFAKSNALDNYRSNNESEYKKIIDAPLVEVDGILILVIMDNYEAIEKYFKQIGAKPPKTE